MIQRLIILSCFCLISHLTFSQSVDSLLRAAELLEGKPQAAAFEKIAQICYDSNYVMKANEYFSKSLEISKSINDPKGRMNALKGLLRTAYHKEDSIELSMEYAGRLEELSVEYDNKMMQAYVLHHYGRADREDFNLSIKRLRRALKIYQDLGKKKSIAIIYNELGQALLDSMPNQAFIYFKNNLDLSKEFGKQQDIYLARSNMSAALIAMKDYENARRFCERNIELAEAADDQDFLAYSHLLIGVSYKNQGNLSKAIEYGLKGLEITEANNIMNRKQYTYQFLKEIYQENGNVAEAFKYFAKEKQIEAELEKQRSKTKLELQKKQFELDQRNKELESIREVNYYKNLAKNALIFLMCIAGVILYMFNVRRRLKVQLQKEEIEKLKVEQMLETEERERLKERLEYKERELASNTIFMLQKNKMLTDLKEKIGSLKVTNDVQLRKQVKSLDRNIDLNMNFDDDWQKFKLHFDEVHPNFFEKIISVNPALSNNETRFCAYIRMGLSTKEIAQLMAISAGSVQKARYRLKKKLGLGKEVNLIEFITTL